MRLRTLRLISLAAAGVLASSAHAGSVIGPTPYTSSADSPFASVDFSAGYFHLEDFEDATLNTPGLLTQPIGTPTGPGGLTDSVDADDGSIDGNGTNGHSYFGNGPDGFNILFDAAVLGSLPTHAGVVWTDGDGAISFEAFDQDGNSIGTVGPIDEPGVVPDDSFVGGTAEDRFFGAQNDTGIKRLFISNSSGGIEIDHIQYGSGVATSPPPPPPAGIPLPAGVWGGMMLFGAAGTALRKARGRS